jgi:hypothetical protein
MTGKLFVSPFLFRGISVIFFYFHSICNNLITSAKNLKRPLYWVYYILFSKTCFRILGVIFRSLGERSL